MKVDVTKCHTCHAQCRDVTCDQGHPMPWVPRLPHKTMVGATPATQKACGYERLCQTYHVKRNWISPSTMPAVHSATASRATRARLNQTQARHTVPWMPRLPRKTMVGATAATQNACGCEIIPRLLRETKVDVTKCHAYYTRDQGAPKPDPSAPPSAMSTTPATQNDGGCHACHAKVDASLCYACHVKRRWMSSLCHACHVNRRWMSKCHACHAKGTQCHACHANCMWEMVCSLIILLVST